jgi:hypothetical protein
MLAGIEDQLSKGEFRIDKIAPPPDQPRMKPIPIASKLLVSVVL